MKRIFLSATFGLAVLSLNAFGEDTKWTGTISDSNCAAKHAASTAASTACVEKCVKGGADPVFVNSADGKVLKIDAASKDKVMAHLGHKVTITGKLDGDTVTVDSVKM